MEGGGEGGGRGGRREEGSPGMLEVEGLDIRTAGDTLNCVKVDLTLFCLFLETSKMVNSYLAFTSVSVWWLSVWP